MTYEKQREMITFVRGESGKPFEWGVRDCNTLALGCLDILTGCHEQFIDIAYGRYDDEASARKYAENYGLDLDGVLRRAGAVEVAGPPEPGDFLLVRKRGAPWLCTHIAISGTKFVTADPHMGCVIVLPLRALRPDYYIMRLEQ